MIETDNHSKYIETRGHMLVETTVRYSSLPLKDLCLQNIKEECLNFTANNIAKTWLAAEKIQVIFCFVWAKIMSSTSQKILSNLKKTGAWCSKLDHSSYILT